MLLAFLSFACQEGLDPTQNQNIESFIKGNVVVISGRDSWPPVDSVLELRVVGFKNYPPKDIIGEIMNGEAFFTDSLPRFIDTIPFSLKIDKPPVELRYIVCALRYGSILEWKVVGVFSDDTSYERIPKSIFVPKGRVFEGILIYVDFYHLPQQPF